MPFQETTEGRTNYCEACVAEAEEHTCGKSTPPNQDDKCRKCEQARGGFAHNHLDHTCGRPSLLATLNQEDVVKELKYILLDAGLKPIHFELNNSGVRILNTVRSLIAQAKQAGMTEERKAWLDGIRCETCLKCLEDN